MIDFDDAVFAWTTDIFPHHEQPRISLAEAQALVQHVWFFYRSGDNAPTVVSTTDNRQAWSDRNTIELPQWAQVKYVVLHEAAHSLGFNNDGSVIDEGYDHHGPLFVERVIDLYAMFMGVSRAMMIERARHFGIMSSSD